MLYVLQGKLAWTSGCSGFFLGFNFFHAVLSLNCASRVGVPVTGDTHGICPVK